MPTGLPKVVNGKVVKGGKKNSVHPKSRRANKIGKSILHGQRLEQRQNERQVKEQTLADKLLWFQSALEDDEELATKRALSRDDLKGMVERFIENLNAQVEELASAKKALPSKRIVNNSQLSRESKLTRYVEKEKILLNSIGIEVPDLMSVENVKRLREWDGTLNKLLSIKTIGMKI